MRSELAADLTGKTVQDFWVSVNGTFEILIPGL
jgi:hypothetical protein